ncbi:Maf family protein [Kozakia baliensis]|uniref:Nucleoside triphosphate pyrophosphatase n=1 Tax=Kozakia baliensis TaxID=153496 RepID=A0A1D8UW96_9PROT|nr:Maf family protein [Kozakia baliensis]AOX17910.1 hypothetical protein A0U89_13120 [Kozakia baliensis]GBR26440.1 septum formation inhibitor nucleotide-binding protein Maf [Kozakia baliensis NRIC 0488]GEL64359.1 Maf-like protein [Kozakia baliensis]
MNQSNESRLVLASGSTARLALLQDAGLAVTPRPVTLDEAAWRDRARARAMPQREIALGLAHAKARRLFEEDASFGESWVIAADQVLDYRGTGFDKPTDLAEARRQLCLLRGQTHMLCTALVLYRQGQPVWEHVETPHLTMRHFSDAFLENYLSLEGEHILNCVGGYRLEGMGVQLFEKIDGAFDAILGLPRLPLLAALRRFHLVME